MVCTSVPGMLNLILSISEKLPLALACSIAALRVHWFPVVEASTSQVLSVVDASGWSPVLFTVKVLEAARAGGASMPTTTSAARRAMATIHAGYLSTQISLRAMFLSMSLSSLEGRWG